MSTFITGYKMPWPKPTTPNANQVSVEAYDHVVNHGLAVVNYVGALKTRVEVTGSTTYVGETQPGSLEADPHWRIQRIVDDGIGGKAIDWAMKEEDAVNPDRYATFEHAWTDRVTLTYG